jgi:hypothetical protein
MSQATVLEPGIQQDQYEHKSKDIKEEFKDFLEWLNTVPEPIRETRPIEILYIVYAHERNSRKTG